MILAISGQTPRVMLAQVLAESWITMGKQASGQLAALKILPTTSILSALSVCLVCNFMVS